MYYILRGHLNDWVRMISYQIARQKPTKTKSMASIEIGWSSPWSIGSIRGASVLTGNVESDVDCDENDVAYLDVLASWLLDVLASWRLDVAALASLFTTIFVIIHAPVTPVAPSPEKNPSPMEITLSQLHFTLIYIRWIDKSPVTVRLDNFLRFCHAVHAITSAITSISFFDARIYSSVFCFPPGLKSKIERLLFLRPQTVCVCCAPYREMDSHFVFVSSLFFCWSATADAVKRSLSRHDDDVERNANNCKKVIEKKTSISDWMTETDGSINGCKVN